MRCASDGRMDQIALVLVLAVSAAVEDDAAAADVLRVGLAPSEMGEVLFPAPAPALAPTFARTLKRALSSVDEEAERLVRRYSCNMERESESEMVVRCLRGCFSARSGSG